MNFNDAIKIVLDIEGGYSDHKDDSGGKTNYGITEDVARSWGYSGNMRELTQNTAKKIYKDVYWDAARLGDIQNGRLRFLVFDTAVHMGASIAVLKLQKIYNIITGKDIAEDGVVGPETLGAVNGYNELSPSHKMVELKIGYLILRGNKYFNIVSNNISQRSFIRGWMVRLARLAGFEDERITTDQAVDKIASELKDVLKED